MTISNIFAASAAMVLVLCLETDLSACPKGPGGSPVKFQKPGGMPGKPANFSPASGGFKPALMPGAAGKPGQMPIGMPKPGIGGGNKPVNRSPQPYMPPPLPNQPTPQPIPPTRLLDV